MVFEGVGQPLRLVERPVPEPGPGQLLLRVLACGICRTDLHLLDGEVIVRDPPRVLGHQIVGEVQPGGRRVGVPWLGWTCGECRYCRAGQENLCERARFTGCDIDGGFAEYALADERFCFKIPDGYPDVQAAPLLCAGLIGYRSLRMCGDARRSASTASAPPRTSSCRSRGRRIARCSRSPAPATGGPGVRARAGRGLGRPI
jgi:propanol-preferring alcohol dehydrogenase